MIDIKILSHFPSDEKIHTDVVLIFVFRGAVALTTPEQCRLLKKGEIYIVNSNTPYSIDIRDEGILCLLYIQYKRLCRILGVSDICFENKMSGWSRIEIKEFDDLLNGIISIYVHHIGKERCLFEAAKWKLLDFLIEQCAKEQEGDREKSTQSFLVQYVQKNYMNEVTVQQAAEAVHMSESAFYRYFKKTFGVSFMQYVNQTRMEAAAEMLVKTGKSALEIALDCGFANASVLGRNFKNHFGCTPKEYRRKYMESGQYPEEEEMSWNYVKDFMEKEGIDGRKALAVKARADVREKRVFVNVWNQAVNIGPARYVLLTKVQEHILMLHKELKFKYIRLWNIFSTRMFFRKSHQTTQLNYQYVDDVLDFCVKNHIYPLIDLGNRPETVPGSEKDLYKDVRQDMGSSHVIFQSLEEWYAIVGGFVEHIVTRYGNSEVAHWIFELWQDMSGNDFYGIQGYFTVLDSVIRLIKDKIPEAKVGGGGWGGEKQFVEGCQGILKMKNRPDFISLYLYLIHRDDMQDTNVRQYYEKDYMKNILENWTGIMKSMGLEKIKLYVTEWNLSIENHNYFNDSCGKAAMMLNVMIECMFSLDMGCYFSGTDRTLSDYDSIGILDGNLGLISKAGLKKPSWYALKFMGKMGNFLIDRNKNYLITADEDGNYQILITNFKNFSLDYSAGFSENLSVREMDYIYDNDDAMNLVLTLTHLPESQYILKKYSFGKEARQCLSTYDILKKKTILDQDDIELLKYILTPQVSVDIQKCSEGILSLHETMEANSFCFVEIAKI